MTAHVLTLYKYKLARKKIKLKCGLREERLFMDKHSIRDITYLCFFIFFNFFFGKGRGEGVCFVFVRTRTEEQKRENLERRKVDNKKKKEKKLYCKSVLFYIDFQKNNRDRSEGC